MSSAVRYYASRHRYAGIITASRRQPRRTTERATLADFVACLHFHYDDAVRQCRPPDIIGRGDKARPSTYRQAKRATLMIDAIFATQSPNSRC